MDAPRPTTQPNMDRWQLLLFVLGGVTFLVVMAFALRILYAIGTVWWARAFGA